MLRKSSIRKFAATETIYENRTVSVGLNVQLGHLDLLLRETIKLFSNDKELCESAHLLYSNIPAIQGDETEITLEDLDQVATLLEEFVSSTSSLPGPLVAFVHTCIGLIRQEEQRYNCAIDSFVKALWIKTSSQAPPDQIAVASHRLGVTYGQAMNYTEARNLLQKALKGYEDAELDKDHPFVLNAMGCLDKYEARGEIATALRQTSVKHLKQMSITTL